MHGGNSITGGTQGTVVQAGRIDHLVVQQAPPPADEVTVAPPFGRRGTPLRGRAELLAALATATGTHVLHGLGGVGKTSLALAAADAHARAGAPVWWVAAQDDGRLAGGLRAVARRLGLREDELAAGGAVDLLWQRLAALPGRWLLVVDNADDLALLDGPGSLAEGTGRVRAPAGATGLVLVTTRDGDPAAWGAGPVLHPLGALPGPAAADALADRAGDTAGPAADAERLAARLGGLPLALDSAGRYLASVAERPAFLRGPGEPATYTGYLDALGTGDLTVDGDGTLARIWAMSLRLLVDRGHARVGEVLRLLAGFADAPVPLRVLDPERIKLPPGELWDCLKALDRIGLAALAADTRADPAAEPVVTVHPLVRDAHRGARETLSAQAALAAEEPEERTPLWPLLVPHLLDALTPGTPAPVWDGALLAVRSLAARGLMTAAAEAAAMVRDGTARDLPGGHHTARRARLQEGMGLAALSQGGPALGLLTALAEECAGDLGADDPFTLEVRHERAIALQMCGEPVASHDENAAVLAARLRHFGPDDWRTLHSRHNLAMNLALLGRVRQALAELDAVCESEARTLGQDHPDTLTTRENRAIMLRVLGDPAAALAELTTIAEVRTRILGPEHPDTLTARFNRAVLLPAPLARAELAAVLDARVRVLGPGHPVTEATRATLDRAPRTLP